MALTKSDLKQIRTVVREEVEAEVKDSTKNIEGQIRLSRAQIQNEIRDLDNRMKNVEIRADSITKNALYIRKKVRKIEKTTDIMIKAFDEEDVKLSKRVDRIELHLDLPKEN